MSDKGKDKHEEQNQNKDSNSIPGQNQSKKIEEKKINLPLMEQNKNSKNQIDQNSPNNTLNEISNVAQNTADSPQSNNFNSIKQQHRQQNNTNGIKKTNQIDGQTSNRNKIEKEDQISQLNSNNNAKKTGMVSSRNSSQRENSNRNKENCKSTHLNAKSQQKHVNLLAENDNKPTSYQETDQEHEFVEIKTSKFRKFLNWISCKKQQKYKKVRQTEQLSPRSFQFAVTVEIDASSKFDVLPYAYKLEVFKKQTSVAGLKISEEFSPLKVQNQCKGPDVNDIKHKRKPGALGTLIAMKQKSRDNRSDNVVGFFGIRGINLQKQ